MSTKVTCGFYAVNKKHCIIKGKCVVCKSVVDGKPSGDTIHEAMLKHRKIPIYGGKDVNTI